MLHKVLSTILHVVKEVIQVMKYVLAVLNLMQEKNMHKIIEMLF